jgi:transcriptional regulator with XRE-family HTH domain
MEKNKRAILGDRIKALREEEGISQSDLAEKINITRQSMSKYETGKHSPDIGVIDSLADYFQCSVDYLFGRTSFKRSEAGEDEVEMETCFNEALKSLTNDERNYFLERVTDLATSISMLDGLRYKNEYLEAMIDILARIPDFAKIIRTIHNQTRNSMEAKLPIGEGNYKEVDSRSPEYVLFLNNILLKLVENSHKSLQSFEILSHEAFNHNFPLSNAKEQTKKKNEKKIGKVVEDMLNSHQSGEVE